jgi:adenylate cyclase class 2
MSHSGSKQETEVKLRVANAADAQHLIAAAGFQVSVPRIFEANTIYDSPDAALRQRGSVLRLRRAGDKVTLTLKGQPSPGKHKSRPEDEIVVSDYETADRILTKLGYQPTFRYEKYRTEFAEAREPGTITAGTITLDETPIGTFLELEGSPEWIDATAGALGFHETDYILESYGKLYINFCSEQSRNPTEMTFTG